MDCGTRGKVGQGGGQLTRCRLYLDEDSQAHDFIAALKSAGVDVLNSAETGMDGTTDLEQLLLATSLGRVLYSRNIRDFRRLHVELSTAGNAHSGLIFGVAGFSVGERLRRVLRIFDRLSAEDITNTEQFLSQWGDDQS